MRSKGELQHLPCITIEYLQNILYRTRRPNSGEQLSTESSTLEVLNTVEMETTPSSLKLLIMIRKQYQQEAATNEPCSKRKTRIFL